MCFKHCPVPWGCRTHREMNQCLTITTGWHCPTSPALSCASATCQEQQTSQEFTGCSKKQEVQGRSFSFPGFSRQAPAMAPFAAVTALLKHSLETPCAARTCQPQPSPVSRGTEHPRVMCSVSPWAIPRARALRG